MLMEINYSVLGMHYFWWLVWVIVLFWIFVLPYNFPGQKLKKDSALDILKKRLASGEITNDEYIEKKKILDKIK